MHITFSTTQPDSTTHKKQCEKSEIFLDFLLTTGETYDIISEHSERYRSGYNGTVLKTVVRQRTVGSNPTLSATLSKTSFHKEVLFVKNRIFWFCSPMEDYSSGEEAPLLRE